MLPTPSAHPFLHQGHTLSHQKDSKDSSRVFTFLMGLSSHYLMTSKLFCLWGAQMLTYLRQGNKETSFDIRSHTYVHLCATTTAMTTLHSPLSKLKCIHQLVLGLVNTIRRTGQWLSGQAQWSSGKPAQVQPLTLYKTALYEWGANHLFPWQPLPFSTPSSPHLTQEMMDLWNCCSYRTNH